MADRATGGAGKPPLYKIVMLGDSGVGKTSLGRFLLWPLIINWPSWFRFLCYYADIFLTKPPLFHPLPLSGSSHEP